MFNHILIPVAPGHAGEYGRAMKSAEKMLAEGGKISILSVQEFVPAYYDAYMPTDFVDQQFEEIKTEVRAEFAAEGPEIHVARGHAANTILKWVDDHSVDCIVMPSHRPGFADFLIGSTAARVVRHAQCSVVVLR